MTPYQFSCVWPIIAMFVGGAVVYVIGGLKGWWLL